jgi:hypothetical protein
VTQNAKYKWSLCHPLTSRKGGAQRSPLEEQWRAREAFPVKHDVFVNEEVIHIIAVYPAGDILIIMFFNFCACSSKRWQGIDRAYILSYY